jgi:four helix bundle protein
VNRDLIPVTFESWKEQVPEDIREDPLWEVEVYRLSLFASDVCWQDAGTLREKRRTRSLADQLYRSVGSISANVAEGFSRGTGKDRARFYEYALGSARESRDWYFKGRFVLGESVVDHRLDFMTQIIRLLLVMVPDQRGDEIREPGRSYKGSVSGDENLLEGVPFTA